MREKVVVVCLRPFLKKLEEFHCKVVQWRQEIYQKV